MDDGHTDMGNGFGLDNLCFIYFMSHTIFSFLFFFSSNT